MKFGGDLEPIQGQCSHHIKANELIGFKIMGAITLNGLSH